MNNYYAVIMAGGIGSRFWPLSTPSHPKQFLDLMGTGSSLLQITYRRMRRFIPEENIFILTNEAYDSLVKDQLPNILDNRIILEPAMRNTAPCLLLVSLKIHKLNPNAKILVAPSDHWIEKEEAFQKDVESCFLATEQEGAIVTLGIKPTFAHTGYGYIETDNKDTSALKKVIQFREKPDPTTAENFIRQGNFNWNAGIFTWSAKTLINAFKELQPNMYLLFEKGLALYNSPEEKSFIASEYAHAENISIDYAILEKASTTLMKEASFDWNDLGTWKSIFEKLPKDEKGNAILNTNERLDSAIEDPRIHKDSTGEIQVELEHYRLHFMDGKIIISHK